MSGSASPIAELIPNEILGETRKFWVDTMRREVEPLVETHRRAAELFHGVPVRVSDVQMKRLYEPNALAKDGREAYEVTILLERDAKPDEPSQELLETGPWPTPRKPGPSTARAMPSDMEAALPR
jgi:hypothetical protein